MKRSNNKIAVTQHHGLLSINFQSTKNEQVVANLLKTTKALLEALSRWAFMRATSNEIYKVNNVLEEQFYLVSQAFEGIGILMSDLHWIPRELRDAITVAMTHSPSPEALNQYLPPIRNAVVSLLHGLKAKQALERDSHHLPNAVSSGLRVQPVKKAAPPQKLGGSVPCTALAALKQREKLARRSSVRKTSTYGSMSRNPVKNTGCDSHSSLNTLMDEPKSMTLFLQMGNQVQKVKYSGDLSIPALNMLFLETFNNHLEQNDFPKIYIRDPEIGIFYELVDISDIQDKCILSFHIDDKKEWLEKVTGLFKELTETRRLFMEQLVELKKQITRESNSVKDAFIESVTTGNTLQNNKIKYNSKGQLELQRKEIEALKRQIALLCQSEKEMRDETQRVISEIKQKSREKAADTTGRSTAVLIGKSEEIIKCLEELQDTMDQLTSDVTQQKCRPSEAQMTRCAQERDALAKDIDQFGQYIARVKPRWKHAWEKELQAIVQEQQVLKDQEHLLSDMRYDLDAIVKVYDQLEKIGAYQASMPPQISKFKFAPIMGEGMDDVLKQLETIDVDHDLRVRALERADKMRQRELTNRINDFEKELLWFVEKKKLKKTGGTAEMDKIREQKDKELLKLLYTQTALG